MSFFNRKEKRQAIAKSMTPFVYVAGGNTLVPNELVSAELALNNSDVFAVVSLISADIASAGFTGVNVSKLGLLNNPSNIMNNYNFWQLITMSMLLNGNGFAVIEDDNLRYVDSATVQIDFTDEVLTYTVQPNGDYRGGTYSADEILHFKINAFGSSGSELFGTSPLQSLASELVQQQKSNDLATATLTKAINPATVIKVQGAIDEKAKQAIREQFGKVNGGREAGGVMIIDMLSDVQTVSINNEVAQFLNTVATSRTAISKAFGVPDSMINGSNSDEQSSLDMINSMYQRALKQRYINPINAEVQSKISNKVWIDTDGIFDFNNDQFKTDIVDFVNAGILTPAQAVQQLTNKGVLTNE